MVHILVISEFDTVIVLAKYYVISKFNLLVFQKYWTDFDENLQGIMSRPIGACIPIFRAI